MPGLNRSRRRPGGLGGPLSVQMVGADALADVAKALRQAGDKDLRRELYSGLRRSAKPLIAAARDNARDTLPKHGQLNERVARSKFKVQTRGAGRNPGVRITASGVDTRLDTQGRLRHPVYGNRNTWVIQKVPAHWFTGPMERGAPRVRRELITAIATVARKIEKS
jgi:hypothetical protein